MGLGVALGCPVDNPVYITDQENMLPLIEQNVELNGLQSRVVPLVLNWQVYGPKRVEYGSNKRSRGDPLPEEVVHQKPNVILAADCVYFEPAFPLLLNTLQQLLDLCEDAVIYFCFKKRRRADMQFMKNAKKKFAIEEIEDADRETFSREGLFLYTFKRKS